MRTTAFGAHCPVSVWPPSVDTCAGERYRRRRSATARTYGSWPFPCCSRSTGTGNACWPPFLPRLSRAAWDITTGARRRSSVRGRAERNGGLRPSSANRGSRPRRGRHCDATATLHASRACAAASRTAQGLRSATNDRWSHRFACSEHDEPAPQLRPQIDTRRPPDRIAPITVIIETRISDTTSLDFGRRFPQASPNAGSQRRDVDDHRTAPQG